MTIDDAINILEIHTDEGYEEAVKMAISALRAQRDEASGVLKTIYETPESCPHCFEHLSLEWAFCPECGHSTPWNGKEEEKNEPMTMEELRGMGDQPYYHVSLQGMEPHWAILDSLTAKHIEDCHYGERWLAYRHPTKEDV